MNLLRHRNTKSPTSNSINVQGYLVMRIISQLSVTALFVCSAVMNAQHEPINQQGKVKSLATYWPRIEPERAGVQPQKLDGLYAEMSSEQHHDLKGIVILRDGRLVSEHYFNGDSVDTLHDIRSATKSITALLMGIAIQKHLVKSADDPISAYLPGLPRDVAIVIGGYQFAHGEPGAKKALAGVAAGTGIAVLAVNVLTWLWGV